MRSICTSVVIVAMGLLLVPQLAAATDVEAELRQMQERMARMEERLQATTDDLASASAKVDKQRDVIEAAGLSDERATRSGLSAFIEKTDINSWVATSYNYNTNGSSNPRMALGGQNNTPHHPNPNTFQLDQFWIEIDKAATEESRAGYHVDLKAAAYTGGMGVALHSASVSYLAPIGRGIEIEAGKMNTMFGAEVEQANANFNITRGLVWGLQPITNTGFVASTEVIDGLSFAAGMLNNPISDPGFDTNSGKALTSQVAFSQDKFSASGRLNWGIEPAGAIIGTSSNDYVGLLDVLLTADPTDNLSVWLNYDFLFQEDTLAGGAAANGKTHAIAVAARLGILDSTGAALRFEYVRASGIAIGLGETNAYSLTGTVDHGLTENLTLKGEVRWDRTDPVSLTPKSLGAAAEKNQVLLLAQLLYEF